MIRSIKIRISKGPTPPGTGVINLTIDSTCLGISPLTLLSTIEYPVSITNMFFIEKYE